MALTRKILPLLQVNVFRLTWTSSSYSMAALEFEKEHEIGPVYDSPRMSRRSLKLHTMRGLCGNKCLSVHSQNHSMSHSRSTDFKKWSVRNRKEQKCRNQMLQSRTALLSHSCIGQSKRSELSYSSVNGAVGMTHTHSTLENDYICKDCSIHAEREQTLTAHSVLSIASSSSASHSEDIVAVLSSRSSVYSLDKNHWHKRGLLLSASDSVRSVCSWLLARGNVLKQSTLWRICYMVNSYHTTVCASVFSVKGKTVSGAFWWLGTGWYQLMTMMSLINIFILTRCLPKLLKLLLCLLPFLLLFGLWYLGPSSVIYYLPTTNLTKWRTKMLSLPPVPSLSYFSMPFFNSEPGSQKEPITPPATSQPVAVFVDAERVGRLEQHVATLWESVQQREQRTDQQHDEALGLVHALQEQINTQTDKGSPGLWISQLLGTKFNTLRVEVEREVSNRVQMQDENMKEQKAHSDQLAQLEVLLQVLAYKTEEVQQEQKVTAPPAPVNVTQVDNDMLLAEVQRLKAELKRVKEDLKGVTQCRWKCGQLDTLYNTVSAKVREELYALFYGNKMVHNRDMKLPDSLMLWLSSQYTNSSDLLATLAVLERTILGNVSLQLKQRKKQLCDETVTQTVVHTAGAAGMTEEQVQLIVLNALKLYSQDRTGLVDYALESGGGSILSTRCSETYETKTALMSLFGVPLWYFSQSPRVVIQPDVYPGNCWAFKGSQGYLVIRLSLSVMPTAFCLEHIPKALSPTGNISSAPRHFKVYGLVDEYQEEGKLLGDYMYREDGESLQTFPVVENNDRTFQIIEMRVLSNWGHPEYTCLYRFRVHGHLDTK
ncbi:SUN domain-containing protein 1-like isoform X2 [Colossoma macropomum]|uniref:SUN domain-containing protein 1-like isoform X2 n=1 Tax=Colossoma macropomum TaxID=42526 RepID=UPI0018645B22|nr:SUN domain-containing protein 1-like isoform X2 [Colossoma macropomum]